MGQLHELTIYWYMLNTLNNHYLLNITYNNIYRKNTWIFGWEEQYKYIKLTNVNIIHLPVILSPGLKVRTFTSSLKGLVVIDCGIIIPSCVSFIFLVWKAEGSLHEKSGAPPLNARVPGITCRQNNPSIMNIAGKQLSLRLIVAKLCIIHVCL